MIMVNTYWLNNEFIGTMDDIYTMDWKHFLLSAWIGLAAFCAMNLNVVGYQFGDGTKVSWLEYTNIPLSFLYQSYVFHDKPNIVESIGAVMILFGCLLPMINQIVLYILEQWKIRQEEIECQTESEEIGFIHNDEMSSAVEIEM